MDGTRKGSSEYQDLAQLSVTHVSLPSEVGRKEANSRKRPSSWVICTGSSRVNTCAFRNSPAQTSQHDIPHFRTHHLDLFLRSLQVRLVATFRKKQESNGRYSFPSHQLTWLPKDNVPLPRTFWWVPCLRMVERERHWVHSPKYQYEMGFLAKVRCQSRTQCVLNVAHVLC